MANSNPQDEIAELEAKLAASQRMPGGYDERIAALKRRIEELRDAE